MCNRTDERNKAEDESKDRQIIHRDQNMKTVNKDSAVQDIQLDSKRAKGDIHDRKLSKTKNPVENTTKQRKSNKLTGIKSHLKLPGQSQDGENPSSTLTSRVFTKVKKNVISAQRFPCFIKKSQAKETQVIHI